MELADPDPFERMVSVLLSHLFDAQRIEGAGGDRGKDMQFRTKAGLTIVQLKSFKTFDRKSDAQQAGRATAQRNGVEHFIHKKDGSIGGRNSYGNDPHPPKG